MTVTSTTNRGAADELLDQLSALRRVYPSISDHIVGRLAVAMPETFASVLSQVEQEYITVRQLTAAAAAIGFSPADLLDPDNDITLDEIEQVAQAADVDPIALAATKRLVRRP